VKIIPEEEFRNTYSDNTIDTTTEDDKIVVMTLDTAMQRFRYAPPSLTTSSNVFYLYYWKYFDRISTEGRRSKPLLRRSTNSILSGATTKKEAAS
jgi:hypothetical protein